MSGYTVGRAGSVMTEKGYPWCALDAGGDPVAFFAHEDLARAFCALTGGELPEVGEHTPGPWEAVFDRASSPHKEHWRVVSPAGLTVATVAFGRYAEANARIMAAAPALLARPAEPPALYELLSDAAAALVALPRGRDLDAAVAHLAGELVGFGVDHAGLTLGDLRGLAANLQNELTDAILREVDR